LVVGRGGIDMITFKANPYRANRNIDKQRLWYYQRHALEMIRYYKSQYMKAYDKKYLELIKQEQETLKDVERQLGIA
jgi:hypothetical protein